MQLNEGQGVHEATNCTAIMSILQNVELNLLQFFAEAKVWWETGQIFRAEVARGALTTVNVLKETKVQFNLYLK
jgi:hypothetical protein